MGEVVEEGTSVPVAQTLTVQPVTQYALSGVTVSVVPTPQGLQTAGVREGVLGPILGPVGLTQTVLILTQCALSGGSVSVQSINLGTLTAGGWGDRYKCL